MNSDYIKTDKAVIVTLIIVTPSHTHTRSLPRRRSVCTFPFFFYISINAFCMQNIGGLDLARGRSFGGAVLKRSN